MKLLLKVIRAVLGWILITLDRVFPPRIRPLTAEQKAKLDQNTQGWILYHFEGCPFCIKVRRQIRRLGLRIESREVLKNPQFKAELLQGGGEIQVPCLKIPASGQDSERWMYESTAINDYLEKWVLLKLACS